MSKYYIPGYGEVEDEDEVCRCTISVSVTPALRVAIRRQAALKGTTMSEYMKQLTIADLNSDPHPLPENDSD